MTVTTYTKKFVSHMIEAGYQVAVYCEMNDECDQTKTTDKAKIWEAMDATSESYLRFYKDGVYRAWALFIGSNDVDEQISDYSVNDDTDAAFAASEKPA